jgi:hypothetical protein
MKKDMFEKPKRKEDGRSRIDVSVMLHYTRNSGLKKTSLYEVAGPRNVHYELVHDLLQESSNSAVCCKIRARIEDLFDRYLFRHNHVQLMFLDFG